MINLKVRAQTIIKSSLFLFYRPHSGDIPGSVTLPTSIWPREVLTILVLNEESSFEHLSKHLLGVLFGLLLGLNMGELLLESVNEPKLLLKCLCLGLRGGLVILDLLLGPSSLTSHLHTK